MKKYLSLRLFYLIFCIFAMLPEVSHADQTLINTVKDTNTTVVFQVNATKLVQQDKLVADLRVQKTSLNVDSLQSFINIAMKEGLAITKNYGDVTASTGSYNVYKDDQKGIWNGQQFLHLESKSIQQMAELIGALQKKGFAVSNYNYVLSDEKRSSLGDELKIQLLEKAKHVAKSVIATQIGRPFLRFSSIEFNDGRFFQPVYSEARMMKGQDFLPQAQADSVVPSPAIVKAGISEVESSATVKAVFGD